MQTGSSSWSIRNLIVVGFVAAALCGSLVIVSCDSAGTSGGGDSKIEGTVESYSAGSVWYRSDTGAGGLARALNALRDAAVVPAFAGVAGVTVKLSGTDVSATTDADGNFVLTGIPGGEYELVFSYEGNTASMALTVPENAVVTISGVDVSGGSVSYDSIEVEVDDSEVVADDNSNTGVDENSNDNVVENSNDNL